MNECQRKRQDLMQLRKMLRFFYHDAIETARTVDGLTEEEFYFEKEKLIQKGKMEVDQLYSKKFELFNRETSAIISTWMTDAKAAILFCRHNHIKSVLADVNKKLMAMRDNKEFYDKILEKLILQAMFRILEDEVNLILIADDVDIVSLMVDRLKKNYRKSTGINVKINIEEGTRLPIQEIGGVMITAKNRKIIVENTLVVRLIFIAQQVLPLICSGLFGPKPTRPHKENKKP